MTLSSCERRKLARRRVRKQRPVHRPRQQLQGAGGNSQLESASVLLEFPDMEAAGAVVLESPEYQDAKRLREGAAGFNMRRGRGTSLGVTHAAGTGGPIPGSAPTPTESTLVSRECREPAGDGGTNPPMTSPARSKTRAQTRGLAARINE